MANEKVQSSKFKVQSLKQDAAQQSASRVVSAARAAAFEILRRVETERGFSAILLPEYEENLNADDRALCHELVLGTLRNQLWLDTLTKSFSGREPHKLDAAVRIILRLALYQLRFLSKMPARAAINEAVNQVYAARLKSAAGFVNAVLRRATREKDFDPLVEVKDPLERLSIETSHPVWLLEKWQKNWGSDETQRLTRANNTRPPIAFRLTPLADKGTLDELRASGVQMETSKLVSNAFRADKFNRTLRELVEAGKLYLQDEASQLVASAIDLQPGERFLDVCAAPGSKTSLIGGRWSERIPNSKFQISDFDEQTKDKRQRTSDKGQVIAGDLFPSRLRILRQVLNKFGAEFVEVVRYDAAQSLPFADQSFDHVLVDAPCSGTGTLRHNPEIRWHLQPADFDQLARRQSAILQNAAQTVKTGGRLIYSTCSLEPEEDEAVVREFLRQNKDFVLSNQNLPEELSTGDGFVHTFPHRHDTDGFFLAILNRTTV